MSVEARGQRVVVAPNLSDDDLTTAARALGDYLSADMPLTRRKREPRVETIDGMPATLSPRLDSFTRAGWRRGVDALRYYGGKGQVKR